MLLNKQKIKEEIKRKPNMHRNKRKLKYNNPNPYEIQ